MKNWNFTNGWSLKTALVNGVSCLTMMNLLIISNPGQTAEQDTLPIEFLEFLGEGIVLEDEYLDPLNYTDIEQDVSSRQSANGTTETQTDEVIEDAK